MILLRIHRTLLYPYHRVGVDAVSHEVTNHECWVTCGEVGREVSVDPCESLVEPLVSCFRISQSINSLCRSRITVDGHHHVTAILLDDYLMLVHVSLLHHSIGNVWLLACLGIQIRISSSLSLHTSLKCLHLSLHLFRCSIVRYIRELSHPRACSCIVSHPHIANADKVSLVVYCHIVELHLYPITIGISDCTLSHTANSCDGVICLRLTTTCCLDGSIVRTILTTHIEVHILGCCFVKTSERDIIHKLILQLFVGLLIYQSCIIGNL